MLLFTVECLQSLSLNTYETKPLYIKHKTTAIVFFGMKLVRWRTTFFKILPFNRKCFWCKPIKCNFIPFNTITVLHGRRYISHSLCLILIYYLLGNKYQCEISTPFYLIYNDIVRHRRWIHRLINIHRTRVYKKFIYCQELYCQMNIL